jgi:hypothetical protein
VKNGFDGSNWPEVKSAFLEEFGHFSQASRFYNPLGYEQMRLGTFFELEVFLMK